jgi:hypothetical protein
MKRTTDPPYALFWGSRLGFAKMAIACDALVVPIASVGATETFPVIWDWSWRWLYGSHRAQRDSGTPTNAAARAGAPQSSPSAPGEAGAACGSAAADSDGAPDIFSPPHGAGTPRVPPPPLTATATTITTTTTTTTAAAALLSAQRSGAAQAGARADAQAARAAASGEPDEPAHERAADVTMPITLPMPQHWQRWYFKIGEVRCCTA